MATKRKNLKSYRQNIFVRFENNLAIIRVILYQACLNDIDLLKTWPPGGGASFHYVYIGKSLKINFSDTTGRI